MATKNNTKTSKKGKTYNTNDSDGIKRLYRSKSDKVIAGVCGGVGEYFKIDPVWVRLIAILLIFVHGIGLGLYVLGWVLIPQNPSQKNTKKNEFEEQVEKQMTKLEKASRNKKHKNGMFIIGGILVALGVLFLAENLFSWFDFDYVWPMLLIVVGFFLLKGNLK